MRPAAVCPDLTQYQQLAADRLTDADEEALLRHLERCDACARKVSTLVEPDRLVKFIRRHQAQGDGAADEGVGRLIQRMSQLRPGTTSAGAAPTPPPAHQTVSVAALIFACPACNKPLKVKGEFAGRMVKCPHCQQAVCAAAKPAAPAAAPVSVVSAAAGSMPATVAGAAVPTGAYAAGKLDNTVDHQPARGPDSELYDFLAPPQAPDELGRLGPYRVLQVLGAGGMGVVFRAEDPQLMRLVALKAMLPALAASASARQRFLREARAAAAITHDHIVTVHQVGEDRGIPYLAMQFLEGEPLDARLQRVGKLTVAEVLRIGRETALGLAAAHERGLIHRDIKPPNLWLEGPRGRVKILDFGLARAVGTEGQLTQRGVVVGTPAYMAPEQGKGKAVDPRCDLFSLGCVLYHMATGEPAFRGSDVVSTLMAVATEHPRPPHERDATVPPALSELITSLLAKEPRDRPPSAQVVAASLERIADIPAASRAAATPSAARLGSPGVQAAPRPRKRGPLLAGLAACLLLVLAGLWAAGVIKLKTPEGTIVLDDLPADAEVFVDGEKVAVKLPGDGQRIEIRVAPGKRTLEIKSAGFKMETREVTVASGERQPIGIRLEPLAAAPKKPARPPEVPTVHPSAALAALRRDQIPPEALAMAGGGDPDKAPASLVGVLGEAHPIHTGGVRSAAFSPDGRWLASGCWAHTVLLRDVATGRVQRILPCRTGAVSALAFSKDGRTLVAACDEEGYNGNIQLWPIEKEAEPQVLRPNLGGIWSMAVSADGRFLAAIGLKGGVNLWKWGQWDTPVEIIPEDQRGWVKIPYSVGSVAFSPDGESLAVGLSQDKLDIHPIRIYKTTDGKLTHTLPGTGDQPRRPSCLTFSRDGKYLAGRHGGWKWSVWEVATWKPIADFEVDWCSNVVFSPDGKTLAFGSNYRVELYDLASRNKVRVLSGSLRCGPMAFSPDGQLFAGGFDTGIVHVWDTATWKEKYLERGHRHSVGALAIGPDGSKVISAGNDDTLRQWDLGRPRTNQIVHQFVVQDQYLWSSPSSSVSLAYSPNGKMFALLAIGEVNNVMIAWDAATRKKRWTVSLRMRAVVFSPDGTRLAGSCEDGTVRLWDADSGTEMFRFPALGLCAGLAFSGDGKLLAAASWDKNCLKVWDVARGTEVHSWQDTSMTAVAFRPDSQVLAIGHKDRTISIWDLAEGKKKRTLKGHLAQVQSLKFTPDGKALVSSGWDGTIRVWNPDWELARHVIALGPANQRLVMDMDASGKYVIAAGSTPLVYVLRLPPRDGQADATKTETPGIGKK